MTLNADGSFTYTPAANFNGTDSFTYTASDGTADSNVATVTITVTRGQRRAGGGRRRGDDGRRHGGQRRACWRTTRTSSRHDADGEPGRERRRTATVTLNADGSFTYTPAANFNGTDSFTYTASDGTAVSNVATVTITVDARSTTRRWR